MWVKFLWSSLCHGSKIWEKTETELVGNILLEKAEESVLAHSGYQQHVQPLLSALYKHIRDAWALTFPRLLTHAVYDEQYLIYQIHLKPSKFAPVLLLECKSITWCCCMSTRSNHSIKDLLYTFFFFFASPMHMPACRWRCLCCRLPASCRGAQSFPWMRAGAGTQRGAEQLTAQPDAVSCLPSPEATLKLAWNVAGKLSSLPPKLKCGPSWRTASQLESFKNYLFVSKFAF